MRLPVLPLALLILAGVATTSPSSRADTTGQGGNSTGLVASDFVWEFFWLQDGSWETIRDSDLELFFNRARCECDTPLKIRIGLITSAKLKVNKPMSGTIKLGTGDDSCVCTSQNTCVNNNCTHLGGEQSLGELANNFLEFETTVGTLFGAGVTDKAGACQRREREDIYILPDGDDSGPYPDVTDASREILLDGEAPPAPTLRPIDIKSGNEALQLSWAPIATTTADDLQGYSIFCARGGTLAPFEGFDARHQSRESLCPAKTGARIITQALQMTSEPRQAESTRAPEPLRNLDPRFLCADFLTSASSVRLTGLENYVPYVVGVAAVDVRGNASPLENAIVGYPFPTRDFYRVYRGNGGSAEGGFCTVSRGSEAPGTGWWPLLMMTVALALATRRGPR